MRPYAGSGCCDSNIRPESIAGIFRDRLAVTVPGYSQKGYLAKCAGNGDKIL